MASRDKLIERVTSNPRDLKWDEFVRFMGYHDFKVVSKKGGSHMKFYNKELDMLINSAKPHNPNVVKTHIIKQALDGLRQAGKL